MLTINFGVERIFTHVFLRKKRTIKKHFSTFTFLLFFLQGFAVGELVKSKIIKLKLDCWVFCVITGCTIEAENDPVTQMFEGHH